MIQLTCVNKTTIDKKKSIYYSIATLPFKLLEPHDEWSTFEINLYIYISNENTLQ